MSTIESQNPITYSELAPIALFVYNRPEHTRRTVESLRANSLARHSDLFVFSDAAKDPSATAAVEAVRKFIRSIDGFRKVTIVERERNLGLSKSVTTGVSQLCTEYGRVIVVEDDILTAPDFLNFLNRALVRYVDEPGVFSISGFNFPIAAPAGYSYDAFFSYRFMCWGWGTWRDRWVKADWLVGDYPEFIADGERQKRLNRGGSDLSWLLTRHMSGRIDSWDTVWAYTHSKHEAIALLSVVSRAYNIGFDQTGVHCRRAPFVQSALSSEARSDYRFPDCVIPNPHFTEQILRLNHRSVPRKVGRYLYDRIGLK